MKRYQSLLVPTLFLTLLVGCGNEQFGTGGQSANSTASPLASFSHQSCSQYTLIKPKVDVVYVVDNSASTFYVSSDIKSALQRTVDSLSGNFDYRVIGTPLISNNLDDYQVVTNSSNLNGINNLISTSSQFNFFSNPSGGAAEYGFDRVYNFVRQQKTSGLIRPDSHIIIVLVSNGRDAKVEVPQVWDPKYATFNQANFTSAYNNLRSVKNSGYQLRFATATAHTACKAGWYSSSNSYVKMSNEIYRYTKSIEGITDQDGKSTPDAYDLCGSGFSSIFASVNSSIQQVTINHGYRFWPISFLENSTNNVDVNQIQVTKVSQNGSRTNLSQGTDWTYVNLGSTVNQPTREVPSSGEPVNGRHFIRFTNLLYYPDCVLVSSVSKTEYYDWVVLPRRPLLPVTIRVNGVEIPQSALNTSQVNTSQTLNIKAPYPTAADESPVVMRTGFMIQITNPQYFYKSGDNVQTDYTPAPI